MFSSVQSPRNGFTPPIAASFMLCAVDVRIAQIGPLSFQAAIEHKPTQVRWGGLHAPVVTEWWPACLHKQFPRVHQRGN